MKRGESRFDMDAVRLGDRFAAFLSGADADCELLRGWSTVAKENEPALTTIYPLLNDEQSTKPVAVDVPLCVPRKDAGQVSPRRRTAARF
jgi:hypothetical protein